MAFSHREKVMNNWARFDVIIWIFVLQILVQSYTASLASFLTAEKLSPTLIDVNQLMENKLNVGYLKDSFVYDILKDMGSMIFRLNLIVQQRSVVTSSEMPV